jgi:hypothetical protein
VCAGHIRLNALSRAGEPVPPVLSIQHELIWRFSQVVIKVVAHDIDVISFCALLHNSFDNAPQLLRPVASKRVDTTTRRGAACPLASTV